MNIGESKGDFAGKQSRRPYEFSVHTGSAPRAVKLNGTLPRLGSAAAYRTAKQGWWYDQDDRGGVVKIKTAPLSTDRKFGLKLEGTSAVGGRKASTTAVVSAPDAQEVGAGVEGTVAVDVTAGSADVTSAAVTLDVPEGWQVTPAKTVDRVPAGTTRRVELAVTPARDAVAGEARITAVARYRAAGEVRTTVQRFAAGVMPSLRPPTPGRAIWSG